MSAASARSARSSSSGSSGSTSSTPRHTIARALQELAEERKGTHEKERQRETAERERHVASDKALLDLKLRIENEIVAWPLREAISLLGLFNLFFLINVDSYTRDDLMSMTAAKLSSQVVRPGLVLDDTVFQGLANFFEGLHFEPKVYKALKDSTQSIVQARRSGEWLLTNIEYHKYLAGNETKEAEPLSEIVKLLTIAKTTLPRVEASLQSLALLLVARNEVHDYSSDLFHEEGTRRTAFFRSLLEVANACTRAYLAENLEKTFEDLTLNPLSFQEEALKKAREGGGTKLDEVNHLKRLEDLKRRQDLALLHLHRATQTLEDKRNMSFQDPDFESSTYAERRIEEHFRSLLFDRLRVLCVYRLQLVNVSAYNDTGRAVKLAAMISDPAFLEAKLPLYWLICVHSLLNSLGYDLHALRAMLDLWIPPARSQVPSLLVRGGPQVDLARQTFYRMREILSHVGKTPETRAVTSLFEGQEEPFLKKVQDFARLFPESLKRRNASSALPHIYMRGTASPFYAVSLKILKGGAQEKKGEDQSEAPPKKDEVPHLTATDIDAFICEVMEWFEHEGAPRLRLDRTLKNPPPELAAEEKRESAPEKNKKHASPKLRAWAKKGRKSTEAGRPAPSAVKS